MAVVQIRGEFRAGSPQYPSLTGAVRLPRLGKVSLTEFLIDTGCDTTTIHPIAARKLGINFSRDFTGFEPGESLGIGGSNGCFREVAEIEFIHSNLARWDTITLPIDIAIPSPNNSTFPSLLGRDVLQYYRLIVDSETGEVILQRDD